MPMNNATCLYDMACFFGNEKLKQMLIKFIFLHLTPWNAVDYYLQERL